MSGDLTSGRKLTRPLGVLLFSAGLLLGMALFGAIVWADFEAVLFNPGQRRDASLRSLQCPVMITKSETGTVTASLTNPLDRSIDRYVRAHITDGYVTLMREVDQTVSIASGGRERLAWEVTADDAAFERFILVRVAVRGRYPLPSREGTCGILVADAPYVTGDQVFGLAFTASLIAMGLGFGLWYRAGQPLHEGGLQAARAMGMLAGSVVVGTIVGWLGWWLPGAIIFLITVLEVGVILGHFLGEVGGEPIV